MDRKYYLYIALFLTISITIGSLVKVNNVVKTDINHFDKLIHIGAYFSLALSWFLTFHKHCKINKRILFIGFAVFVYGIVIEVLQGAFTSFRQADFYDMMANLTGILLAFVFYAVVCQKKQMK